MNTNTTLCYLEKDGAYLMLHRVKKVSDVNRDKWIGVGGHFESEESPEECLLREVEEETGLRLTDWRYRGVVTFVSDDSPAEYMHLFTSSCFTGQMKEVCDEGILEWIPIEQISSLELWEGDKIFLRLLSENAPFFSLKLVYEGSSLCRAALNGRPLNV